MPEIVAQEVIGNKIHVIRGKKVMLDRDLAELYGVETRSLNQAVRRNPQRFPDDFMFRLTGDELKNLKSQIVISSWGGIRKLPLAFTENGVAMLSSILNSERAIQVNIQIMRAFVRIRNLIADNTELRKAIEHHEKRLDNIDREIQIAFATLKSILQLEPEPETLRNCRQKNIHREKRKRWGLERQVERDRRRNPGRAMSSNNNFLFRETGNAAGKG
jgi:hypothetical protein